MPQFAAAAAAAGGTTFATVVSTVLTVASVLYSISQQHRARKDAKRKHNDAQQDRLVNAMTTVGKRDLVLGRVRKGGVIYFNGSTNELNRTYFMHLALAGHEIDAVEQIYLNDQPVTLDENGDVTSEPYYATKRETASETIAAGATSHTLGRSPDAGSVVVAYNPSPGGGEGGSGMGRILSSDEYTLSDTSLNLLISRVDGDLATVTYQWTTHFSYARIWWELGSSSAVADSVTRSLTGLWTAAHRARGVAKLMARFNFNEGAFPSGLVTLTAVIRGAKVYDPRSLTTAWSDNPALLMRHVYQHPQFGKATVSAAEDARIIAAANACDVNHGYVVNGSTDTQKLYRAALVREFGTPAQEILEQLAQSMAGVHAFAGGELYLRAGTYTAPVMSLTDDDLVVRSRIGDTETQEEMVTVVHRERAAKINVLNPRIYDAAQEFKRVALTPLKAATLIAADGEELADELDLMAVFYAPQALHIAGVMIREARDPLTFEASFKLKAYPLELFDVIEFTRARYGWNAKTFIVVGRTWDRRKGLIRLRLKEISAAIYSPDASFSAQGYAPNTALPTPWDIDPPVISESRIYSGTAELKRVSTGFQPTVRVTWDQVQDLAVHAGFIDVQWTTAGTSEDWRTVTVAGDATEAVLLGVEEGQIIVVRARSRNALVFSAWSVQKAHQVVGKTERPNPPTGVSVTQDLVFFRLPSDLDLAGARIRSLPGNVSAPVFSRGTDVISGLVLASPARMERRLYGLQTVMVVAEDTSGNQSDPVSAVLNFGEPDINDAIWDRPYAAESFKGTFTDCALSGGAVQADVDGGSNLYALGNLYGEPDVYATLYKAMAWAADMAIIPYAGTLTLDATTAGNAVTIEYRILGSTTNNLYASADVYAESNVYGTSGEWSAWPGALVVKRSTAVELRVSISSSSERGSISVFTLTLTMDEVRQTFSSIAISELGTRLVPASGSPPRNWVGDLNAVYGMVAVDGSGAIAPRILDYSPVLGPLIELVDATGTPVAGTGTFIVEGNSDE